MGLGQPGRLPCGSAIVRASPRRLQTSRGMSAMRQHTIWGYGWGLSMSVGCFDDIPVQAGVEKLKSHQKGVHRMDTPGGPQMMSIISESWPSVDSRAIAGPVERPAWCGLRIALPVAGALGLPPIAWGWSSSALPPRGFHPSSCRASSGEHARAHTCDERLHVRAEITAHEPFEVDVEDRVVAVLRGTDVQQPAVGIDDGDTGLVFLAPRKIQSNEVHGPTVPHPRAY